MDRINTVSKAVDLFGAGKHGFKNRNVGLGIDPTDFNAEWPNGVQEELLSIIEAGGIVPDIAVRTQVRQAIKRLFGGNVTTVNFAASPFALTADHAGLVLVDATAGNVVINFPAVNIFAALGYSFKRLDATANTVTFNRAGADTIDGVNSVVFGGGKDAVSSFVGDGVSKWNTLTTPRGVSRFVANGTFIVPPGVTTIYVSAVAGGGGGGAGGGAAAGVGGGGAGGSAGQSVIRQSYAVTPGQNIAITIGAGGAAGAANGGGGSGGGGGVGGNTVIGALVTLTGGGGAGGGFNAVGSAQGGTPSAVGYPVGSSGCDSYASSASGQGAPGASSPFGGGGGSGRGGTGGSTPGAAAGGFGAGGGGGGGVWSSGSGVGGNAGAGSAGFVAIEW